MSAAESYGSIALWSDGAAVPMYDPLPGELATQVCVIGAGLGGLSTAYLLAREGREVTLIDALGIGAGESARSPGIFFPPDETFTSIEHHFGLVQSRLMAGSYAHGLALVESIIRRENIDCGFERVDGFLVADSRAAEPMLKRECHAATHAGVSADLLERVPQLDWDTGPCVRFHGLAQCNPLQYISALALAFVRLGGRIHGATHAHRISGDQRRRLIATNRGQISAAHVVVATHSPFNDRVVMHTKQAGYRRYVIALRMPERHIAPLVLWDDARPYHLVRLARDASGAPLLLVAGADHKTGQEPDPRQHHDRLEQWARTRFPMAQQRLWQWSYGVMQPADGPAYLGRNPMDSDNVYILTGDSGNEMHHATIGAMIITDLILERPNAWSALYDPSRKPIHGLAQFASAQADVMAHYGQWMGPAEVASVDQIAPGSGAIMRDGLRRIAVYRAEDGSLQALSARCTHLGCVVHWNALEQSWDCPCHASRFDITGKVLHGPAPAALATVTLALGTPD